MTFAFEKKNKLGGHHLLFGTSEEGCYHLMSCHLLSLINSTLVVVREAFKKTK